MRKLLIAVSSVVLAFAGVGASVAVATNISHKVVICHNVERGQIDYNPPLRNEIEVDDDAVAAHVEEHGDTVGRCGQVTVTVPGPTTTVTETIEVPGPTTTVTETVEVPGETVTERVEVPGPERVVEKEVIVPQYVNVPIFTDRIVDRPVINTVFRTKTVFKRVPFYITRACVPGKKSAPKPDRPPIKKPDTLPYTK